MTSVLHPRAWPVWDVLFPPLCAVCARPLADSLLFCAQCWAEARILESNELPALKHVDMVRAGYYFGSDDVIKAAVHELKYGRLRLLASEMAARLIPSLSLRFVEAQVVWSAVPLHWTRLVYRGFNQSELIARALASMVRHSAPEPLLRRVRSTPTQTSRSRRERAANVRDAFRVLQSDMLPKAVLLIDDVITTGATMDECARTLKAAGVEWVGACAFALSAHK